MGKFIEEFYYGNLDPQARSTKQNKAVQKKMEVLMLNEDYLTENLSGESKKKFLEFVNAWGVVNGESKKTLVSRKKKGVNKGRKSHKITSRYFTTGPILCTICVGYWRDSRHIFWA